MQSQLEIMDNHRKYYENQQITSILKTLAFLKINLKILKAYLII
jgi:hypothetical protein